LDSAGPSPASEAEVPEKTDTEQEETMNHFVVAKDELPHSGSAHRFEGYLYDGAEVSFFISETPPGKGPSLHTHPYAEVFVVQEGELTFTVGEDTVEASGGQIVVTPEGAPHKFTNSGTGQARHVNIHTSPRLDTEWLEEGD
jgi:mannose-6-phosphate isomerase-like protein (cupin superfamily)